MGGPPMALPTLGRHNAKENIVGNSDTDKVFSGSIPKLYDEYLVPLIFEPYATDIVRRLAERPRGRWPVYSKLPQARAL